MSKNLEEHDDESFGFGDEDSDCSTANNKQERLYEHATVYVRKNATKLSKDNLLYLYSRFKYVNEGPCNCGRPSGMFNFDAKAKYDSWKALGQAKTREECKFEYIEKLDKMADYQWRNGFTAREDETESSSKGFSNADKTGTFGMKMSVMAQNDEESTHVDADNYFDLCKSGNLEKLRSVLNVENKDQVDENEMTVLMWACDRGSLEIVKFLVDELKADLNKQDSDGQTCLHYAVSCEHLELVKYLAIKDGLNKNLTDSEGLKAADLTQNKEILQSLSI